MAKAPLTLCLVRAGETGWSAEGRLRGRADLPLSDGGRKSLITDARGIRRGELTAVHHPPDEGGAESAAIIAELAGCKARVVEDLAEPDLGLLDGLTLEVFEDRFPKRFKQWEDDPLSLTPPEGEEMNEARLRILDALGRILGRARAPGIGVVVHPMALGMIRTALAARPPSTLWSLLEARPRIERYVVPTDAVNRLAELGA